MKSVETAALHVQLLGEVSDWDSDNRPLAVLRDVNISETGLYGWPHQQHRRYRSIWVQRYSHRSPTSLLVGNASVLSDRAPKLNNFSRKVEWLVGCWVWVEGGGHSTPQRLRTDYNYIITERQHRGAASSGAFPAFYVIGGPLAELYWCGPPEIWEWVVP